MRVFVKGGEACKAILSKKPIIFIEKGITEV